MTSTKDNTFFDSGSFSCCALTPQTKSSGNVFLLEKNTFPASRMDPSIRPSSQPEILEAHAEHVRETLKLAASLGRVAIVTLAASLGGDVDKWHGMGFDQ